MAQWLRAPAAFPEDRGSIPITHMAPYNCLQLHPQGIQHTDKQNTNVHKIKINHKQTKPKFTFTHVDEMLSRLAV